MNTQKHPSTQHDITHPTLLTVSDDDLHLIFTALNLYRDHIRDAPSALDQYLDRDVLYALYEASHERTMTITGLQERVWSLMRERLNNQETP